MKTSGCLRSVRSAAQVIDAELVSCTAAEAFRIQDPSISGGAERIER